MRDKSARPRQDERFSGGTADSLRGYGGYLTGYAETFAAALKVSRDEVIEAVDGSDAMETFMVVNGNRGTDAPGGSTNRIESEDHDRTGVDKVFVGLTKDQFEQLGDRLGVDVSVSA